MEASKIEPLVKDLKGKTNYEDPQRINNHTPVFGLSSKGPRWTKYHIALNNMLASSL